jgi:hypothetical protein
MAFNAGFGAVMEAVENASKNGGGGSLVKIGHPIQGMWNLSWKKLETKLVRFLHEDPVTVQMHTFVTCRDGKHKDFVCTMDQNLPEDLRRPCYICDNITRTIIDQKTQKQKQVPAKPTTKILAAVVIRRVDDDGDIVDSTREMDLLVDPDDPDGDTEKVEVPEISIIVQGVSFWKKIIAWYERSAATKNGPLSLVNQDYEIKRTNGDKLDTDYNAFNTRFDTEFDTAPKLWDLYGIKYDKSLDYNDDEVRYVADPVKLAIDEWRNRRATPEYYERHLTGKGDVPDVVTESYDETPAETPVVSRFGNIKGSLKERVSAANAAK